MRLQVLFRKQRGCRRLLENNPVRAELERPDAIVLHVHQTVHLAGDKAENYQTEQRTDKHDNQQVHPGEFEVCGLKHILTGNFVTETADCLYERNGKRGV